MKPFVSFAIATLLFSAGIAMAGPKTDISVMFQNFPMGTACSAQNVQGKVIRTMTRGQPKVDIYGYGEIGTIFCRLPDGWAFITDINKRLPNGTRVAGVTVYPDGQTLLTASTTVGLVKQRFMNTLTFQ